MPLGIEAYRNMVSAGTSISQLALVPNGQGQTRIGNASDTNVGFLKRLFNTEASKKLNIAVANDFKAALSRAYSAKVADEAFAAVIGKDGLKGAKLSSSLVARTLSMADQIVLSRLAPPAGPQMMLTMRLEGESASFSLAGMEEFDRQTMINAKKTLTTLHDLLMDMPTDALALQDFSAKILAAKQEAEDLINNSLPDIEGTEKVVAALRKAVSMVDGKIAEATEVSNGNPITYKALSEFAGKYIEGAMRAVAKMPNGGDAYGLTPATKSQLIQTMAKLTRDDGFLRTLADSANPGSALFAGAFPSQKTEIRKVIPQMPNGASLNDTCPDPKAFLGKDFAKKVANYCTAMVMKDLEANLPAKDVSFESAVFTQDLEKAIQKEVGSILNEGNWDPIEKNVTFSLDGVSLKGKSVIVPASHMGGAMTEIYNDGGPKGYNCQSFGEPKHAVNLAHSKFEIDVGGRTETVFSGIRHGVHAALDIATESEFKAANVSRAKETLIAAFTSDPSLVRKALEDPSRPCPFMFNSVSLLTPDFARNLFGSKYENEKKMLQAQTEAYRSLNNQTIEVDVPTPDGTVKVKIKPVVTTFNYGVNWGGVGGLSGLFGGWGVTKDMNARSLIDLNAAANAILADLDGQIEQGGDPAKTARLQGKARAIRTLLEQINEIDQQKTYSSDGHEAYKMASRIAVLTHLLGGVPAWNCKSGKDRTGMMDVECKFLATLVALGKEIPKPGAPLTSEQRLLYRNLLLQSGNHEMQKYNTGVAGYKLEGVGSITERIGDTDVQKVFLGASKIVKS